MKPSPSGKKSLLTSAAHGGSPPKLTALLRGGSPPVKNVAPARPRYKKKKKPAPARKSKLRRKTARKK